jgi:hypothetical protein
MYKVNPRTNAWAPYGYAWVWEAVLADWRLVEYPDEERPGELSN